jgi:hypothetical protein
MITRKRVRSTLRSVSQLALFVLCIALATTRIGLLAHELAGHGGTAVALGARVDQVHLFWFAGGWIHYQLPDATVGAQLAIAMGGIAIELVLGGILWAAARGDALGRRLVRAIGAALAFHAGWYLATGAAHGYGDGIQLYHELGDWRWLVATAAGAITCAAAFFGARTILGPLAATIPGSRRTRIAGTIAAFAVAGGVHGALAVGELAIRRDRMYLSVMTSERTRVVEREAARWETQHPDATPDVRAENREQIEESHRTFPFAWVLGVASAVALVLGARKSQLTEGAKISRRMLARAAIAAAGAIAVVVVTGVWIAV